MKKLLILCLLGAFGICKPMDDGEEKIRDARVRDRSWSELARNIAIGKMAGSDFCKYTKEMLDEKEENTNYTFFETLLREMVFALHIRSFTRCELTKKADHLLKCIEILIVADKITHSCEIATRALSVLDPSVKYTYTAQNTGKLLYEATADKVRNQQQHIQHFVAASQWAELTAYITRNKIDIAYLANVPEAQKRILTNHLTPIVTTPGLPKQGGKSLSSTNNGLIPPASQSHPHQQTSKTSFNLGNGKYAIGGIVILAVALFVYKYHNSSTESEDEGDATQDNKKIDTAS